MTLRSRCLVFSLVLCLSGPTFASTRPDLYQTGKEAYEQGKYVTALKNLYAFYILNADDLQNHQEFKEALVSCPWKK